jgi:hypothetical protein
MDPNHFDPSNILGCPGMQYAPAPSFALWTRLPGCCRSFVIALPRVILCLCLLPIALALGLVLTLPPLAMFIVTFALIFVFGLPLSLYLKRSCTDHCSKSFKQSKVCMLVLGGGILALLTLFVWVPLMVSLLPISGTCILITSCGDSCNAISEKFFSMFLLPVYMFVWLVHDDDD